MLLKYQTVTPKTNGDIVLRLKSGVYATCNMYIYENLIMKIYDNASLVSVSAH